MGFLESNGGVVTVSFWEEVMLVRDTVRAKVAVLLRDGEH